MPAPLPTCSQLASQLLVLPWFTFMQGFSIIQVVISLGVLGLLYQLVSRRALFAQIPSRQLLWWGGLMLFSWALLLYFAIELRWIWRFFFG